MRDLAPVQERKEAAKRIPEQLILSKVRRMVEEMQNLNKRLEEMMEKEKAKTEMMGAMYKQAMLERAAAATAAGSRQCKESKDGDDGWHLLLRVRLELELVQTNHLPEPSSLPNFLGHLHGQILRSKPQTAAKGSINSSSANSFFLPVKFSFRGKGNSSFSTFSFHLLNRSTTLLLPNFIASSVTALSMQSLQLPLWASNFHSSTRERPYIASFHSFSKPPYNSHNSPPCFSHKSPLLSIISLTRQSLGATSKNTGTRFFLLAKNLSSSIEYGFLNDFFVTITTPKLQMSIARSTILCFLEFLHLALSEAKQLIPCTSSSALIEAALGVNGTPYFLATFLRLSRCLEYSIHRPWIRLEEVSFATPVEEEA
ncbi:hypothetical protein Cgig2_021895 [Carnegiea gigantea]|uniref:Uncharacterized protein n=1 Tax=Carnegiea gigantea TaxID=171969 RepID=A0A9Q1GVS3_9CARY|nr:hypothetical protein Cgig2_021895 [Carnegiea gigantea]